MCRAGGRRCPSSLGAARGGTRPSRAGAGRYPKTVRDTISAVNEGTPEEVLVARTRTVLMYPEFVVKVPTTEEGLLGNSMEFATYSDPEGIPVAPCRWLKVNDDVTALVMDRVTPVRNAFSDKSMPWWVGMVDCGQVGHLPDGTLVAYDL